MSPVILETATSTQGWNTHLDHHMKEKVFGNQKWVFEYNQIRAAVILKSSSFNEYTSGYLYLSADGQQERAGTSVRKIENMVTEYMAVKRIQIFKFC